MTHSSLFLRALWLSYIVTQIASVDEEFLKYMKKFGHIEVSNNALVTIDILKQGVESLQRFGHIPVTGVLDERTKELLKTSRCGVRDVEHSNVARKRRDANPTYALNGNFWKKTSLNYCVLNSTTKLGKSRIEVLMQKSLMLWKNASRINFNKVQKDTEADIIVTFNRGSHSTSDLPEKDFDGPGGILAHVTAPPSKDSQRVFIHFDEDEVWVDEFDEKKDCDGIGFFTVATHEVGHALGLNHNAVYGSIMNPYFRSSSKELQLGYIDVLGMYDLYVDNENVGKRNVRKPNPLDYPPHPPDCYGNFDSALVYHDELFLFKKKVVWRLWRGTLVGRRSFWIKEFFRFSTEIERIDAAYRRKIDGKVLFFTGDRYWIFDYIHPSINESLPISTLGFPSNVDSIDAAVVWDGKTYFFKRNRYWRYNEERGRMDSGYPRRIRKWKYNKGRLHAAAGFRNGTTYFFKGMNYWELDKNGYVARPDHPFKVEQLLRCE